MKKNNPMICERLITAVLLTAILLAQFVPVIEAQAAAALTVTPITWNIIGLDSNKVTVGPNLFPIGARVCNSGNATATDVTSAFVFDDGGDLYTGGTYINLRSGSLSAHTTLGTNLTAGSCTDFYYEVEVKRDANAYDTTRKYHITASANSGAVTGSTPTPRELYVEHLVSQSRNAVTDVQLDGASIPAGGTMSLMVGNTYTIKLIGFTATQGYNQLESFINFPNTIFQVLAVSSTFSAGTTPISTLYADACGWDNVTTSPTYRSCIVSDNKSGGDVTVTYTVKILSAGSGGAKTLGTLLYDFSGSSYHYNSDFGISTRYAEIINPADSVSISKAFSPSSIPPGGSSTLTVTLTNTAAVTITGANFSDSLPLLLGGQMVVATPSVYSTSGCGTPTFAPVAGASSFSVSGATLAPNGSCVLNIAVSVPATPTSGTYANTITNFKIGSSPTAGISSNTANLTVSAASGSSGSGLCGVDIATWNFTGAVSGALTTPYLANSPTSSTAAMTWGNGLSMQADTTSGGGNPQPGGLTYGWQKLSPIDTATSAYIQFAVNTNQYSAVKLRFDAQRKANGPNNDELYYSTNGTTWTSKSTFTSTTSWASYPSASTYYDFTGQTNASGITYFRIYGYGANATSSGNDLTVDNVSFTGCGPAAAPTLTKHFNTNPLAVTGTSTLTFTITNLNPSSTLNGIQFTDVLPSGLSFAASSSSSVCGGTLAITTPGTIDFSSGVLAGGAICYITTPAITVSTSGPHPNISGFISSTESGTNATADGSAKESIVGLLPPTIEKLFSANPILSGGTSTLTFTITNPNPGNEMPEVAFTDTFPTSPGAMIVASPVTKSTSGCGTPTFAPNAGDTSISFSHGSITAGGTCTVSILVKVPATTGDYANTSAAVTSTVGGLTIGSDTASSTLVVNAPNPGFTFNKQVSASSSGPWSSFVTVAPTATVYYKFTLENTGDVPLTLTAPVVSDAKVSTAGCSWPATLPVAAPSADSTTSCTVSVTAQAGDQPNVASATAYYNSTPYTATADATYYGVASGALNLSKQVGTSASGPWTTSLTGVTTGSNLYYRFSVINKTGVSLTSLNLTDAKILTATLDACEASFTSPLENNSATFCVLGPVTASGSGTQTNTATVSGVNGVTPYTSANASASYTLAAPLLNLTKSNNNTTLTVGGSTTYVLTVSNAGNTTTSGQIDLIDVLPSGLTVTDGAVTLGGANSANWNCTAASNVLTCSSNTAIAASGTSEFSFTAAVGGSISGTLTNTAQVGGGGTGVTPTSTSANLCTAANTPTQGCAVDSDTATLNAVPLAVNDSDTATAGVAKNIDVLHNDTQLGDTPTGIQSGTISTPTKGTAVYNNNSTPSNPTDDYIVYTPNVSASGTDTFTYTICDITPDCSTATVTVTLNAVPVAVDDSTSATTGVAKDIDVLHNDTQLGDTPTAITTVGTPGHGTATLHNNGTPADPTDDHIVYTSTAGFSGQDTFTYTICDHTSPTPDCSTATVTVQVDVPLIGLAKELVGSAVKISAGVFQLTYKFWVRNYGTQALSSVQVTDNLATVFASPTSYTVQSLTSTDFTVNGSFNGGTDKNLLSATGNTLPVSTSYKTITLVIWVIPASHGPFENTAIASGKDPNLNTVTDTSQNGSNPDPDSGGDPTNNSDKTPITFSGSIFDPPFGVKVYDDSGLPVLRWTMIWINETNLSGLAASVADPISDGTAYAGGLACTPSGSTTTSLCTYEAPSITYPRGRILWEGTMGPDQGHLDAATANNELDISFNVSVLAGTTQINNTASIGADLDGDTIIDPVTEAALSTSSATWPDPAFKNPDAKGSKLLPGTGFAPGLVSQIPPQPDLSAYRDDLRLRLEIPALGVETEIIGVPLLDGSWDTTWLGSRAGYLEGTSFPTWDGNSVITGHVYGYNGKPGPFVNLGLLSWGKQIVIHAYGQKYIYEVRQVKTIRPDDLTVLGHKNSAWLTLLTCKQYDTASGLYKLRTAVQAVLVRVEAESVTK